MYEPSRETNSPAYRIPDADRSGTWQSPYPQMYGPPPKRRSWWTSTTGIWTTIGIGFAGLLVVCGGLAALGQSTEPTAVAQQDIRIGGACDDDGDRETTVGGDSVTCRAGKWAAPAAKPSAAAAPAAEPEPTVAPPPPKPKTYAKLTERQWKKIAKNPDSYSGKGYIVFGVVTQFDSATGSDAFRADVGHKRMQYEFEYETNTILSGAAGDLADVVEGDVFRAKVTVVGSFDYDTQIGGSTTVPLLSVDSITVL